tara:strand:+ start:107 stop:1666 length:1560 start_codon:yes stop_codon:yes gene_type:complete
MQGNTRDKLTKFKEAQDRHRGQRLDEVIAGKEYLENVENPSRVTAVKNPKRFIDESIPSNAIKWLEKNHPGLVEPYKLHVIKRARNLDKVAKFFSDQFGIELHKEHPISVSGAGDVELSPTTPMSDRGPNTEGFSGNARFNRRLNSKNAFSRADLEQLNISTNWQGSVSDFVANRPDITDPVKRFDFFNKSLKGKSLISVNSFVRTSDLGMLKLQQGDLNVDQLEMKQFIESDLKKSGLALSKNDSNLLEKYLIDLEAKEQIVNATKHGSNWDLKTKFKHSTANQRFDQRVEMGQNAVKRQNPKFTKLELDTHSPTIKTVVNGNNGHNGTNGTNGTNGHNGTNGKNGSNGVEVNGKNKFNGSSLGAGKTRTVDSVLNIGTNLATGNYAAAATGTTTLATSQFLQSKTAQKAIAKQVAKLAAKRGGKTALKLIPGLDVVISGKEAWDYLAQGKFDQAGISALSGAIGWIPVVGDGASAALDLTNTGIDIARLQAPNRTDSTSTKKTKKKKIKTKGILKNL